MALSLQTDNGTIFIPGAYASFKVQASPSGTATSGIVVLIGEASQGPDQSAEATLADAFFGPNQAAEVASKYGSGPLVDAFNIAAVPANDDEITGSPQGIYIIKTNVSGKASAALLRAGLADYGVAADKNYGEPGNGISFVVSENVAEVAPTKAFSYVPTPASASLAIRSNGSDAVALALSSMTEPSTLAATINALSGFATMGIGGQALAVITDFDNADTLAVTASGTDVVITASVSWDNTPAAGDVLVIPATVGSGPAWYETVQASCIGGGSSQNVGVYLITAATSTTITATKLHDEDVETPTTPVTVAATAVGSSHTDIKVYKSMTVTNMTGTHRDIISSEDGTMVGVASGASLTLTRDKAWDAQPQVGDQIFIPSTAPSAWRASGVNEGWFRVTASSSSTVTMTKLDVTVSNPASFASTAEADSTDLVCRRPSIDGVGKTLEVASSSNGDAIVRSSANALILPFFVTSASEKQGKVAAQKLSANLTEEITFGGDVVMLLGYEGTTATATITNSTLTTTVTGGAGGNLSISLKNYKTVSELCSFINSQTGYSCSPANNLLGQNLLFPDKNGVVIFDKGTYGIGSSTTNKAGRIKKDARSFFVALRDGSQLLQVGATPAQPSAGLPDAQTLTFLTGGTRGGTSDANITTALRACERLRANFIVPCFSRDASLDVADLLTDASSTYTIDSIHAQTKTHVLAMSQLKRRRNRQAFLSFQGTFNEAKAKAATLASFRCALTNEDFKGVGSDGSIVQFQPWATAVDAAAMQAAGFYRSIMAKNLNTSGILHKDQTFNPEDDTDVEIALQSGLLIARPPEDDSGGWEWVSDQTTYAVDNNFVFNSIQAVYAADLITLTSAQKMEKAFKGKSLADVSASSAAGVFAKIMGELKRLKLIASSSDAPAGFKNANFKIVGNYMLVTAEVKVAVALAFVEIQFVVTEITQSASI